MNRFLRSERVLTVHRELVAAAENSFWALAVEYLPGDQAEAPPGARKVKQDYRESLLPEDFAIFVKLRQWRKERADAEAVPVHTVSTNEQLAEIARRKISSKAGLQELSGIGEARVKKYGDEVIAIVSGAAGGQVETHGEPLSQDS